MSSERTDVELASDLDALAFEMVRRLTERAERSKGDLVAMDELFLLAGEVEASLSAATTRLRSLRNMLDQTARRDA